MWRNLKRQKINVGAVGIIGTFTRIIKRRKEPFFTLLFRVFFIWFSLFFLFLLFWAIFSSFTLISVIFKRFHELHTDRGAMTSHGVCSCEEILKINFVNILAEFCHNAGIWNQISWFSGEWGSYKASGLFISWLGMALTLAT